MAYAEKLIRDKIPLIIAAAGRTPEVQTQLRPETNVWRSLRKN